MICAPPSFTGVVGHRQDERPDGLRVIAMMNRMDQIIEREQFARLIRQGAAIRHRQFCLPQFAPHAR